MPEEKLPEGWIRSPLLSLCEFVRGVSYKRGEARQEEAPGYVPLLRAGNIQDGLIFEDMKFVPEERVSENQLLQKGDVLVAMSSGSKKVVGKAGQLREEWRGTFGAFCSILRPRPVVAPGFFGYFFNTREYRDYIYGASAGVNINNLKKTHFEDIEFPLPPLPEQKRIVAKLDEIMAEIKVAREHLKKAKELLRKFRQSVLNAAVTGKLTEEWRRAHGFENTCDDLNHKSIDPHPKSWQVLQGSDLFEFITSGSRGWAKYYSDSGPLFIRMGNLDHFTVDLDFSRLQHVEPSNSAERARTSVLHNDILVSITADVGMIGIVPEGIGEAYVNQHVAIARLDNSQPAIPEFIAWFLTAPKGGQKQFLDLQRGATKVGLGLQDIRAVEIPLPPMNEQAEIVLRLRRTLQVVQNINDQIEELLERTITMIEESALTKAFCGKLVE